MRYFLFLTTIFCIGIYSCSKTVADPIIELEIVEVVEPECYNPCKTFADLNERDKDMAETAYVLYKDQYDLQKYSEAMPLWKEAYGLAPAANGRVKYQFDNGIVMYTDLYKKSTTKILQQSYLDTVMMLYDKRVECFGDQAYVDGRKAFDLYYNFSSFSTDMDIYSLFKKAIDVKEKKADYFIINPMSKILYDNFRSGKIPLEEARHYAIMILDAIKYGSENCDKDCAAWEIINSYAPARLEALEGVAGFFDCHYYTEKYYPLFLASPTDCEVILSVSRRMLRGGCGVDSDKLVELKKAYNKDCYTPPPPPGLLTQAFSLYNEGKYKEAISKFDEYLASTDDSEKKAKYNLLVAKIYYRDIKNFPRARSYALKAASYKSKWGEPYMLIGKLYASSGPICGPGTGWDSQIVTWPAIDKWKYAKKIDSSISAEANKFISQYQKYMPNTEDVFIRNLKVGSSFTVSCWINEKTIIRTAK